MIWFVASLIFAIYAGLFPAAESALHAMPQRQRRPQTLPGLLVAQTVFSFAAFAMAWQAAIAWGLPWPLLMASIWLFPWIVFWAESKARGWGLRLDEAGLDGLQVWVLPGLLLVSPLTALLVWITQLASSRGTLPWGARRQWGAIVAASQHVSQSEAPVYVAAQRALRSEGEGLRPWIRRGIERVPEGTRVAAARAILARSPDTVALLERSGRPPMLLFGTRLVHQAPNVPVEQLGVELPLLDPHLDLAEAFQQLRGGRAPFALVGQNDQCEGLLDFEFALSLMLQFEPVSAHV